MCNLTCENMVKAHVKYVFCTWQTCAFGKKNVCESHVNFHMKHMRSHVKCMWFFCKSSLLNLVCYLNLILEYERLRLSIPRMCVILCNEGKSHAPVHSIHMYFQTIIQTF